MMEHYNRNPNARFEYLKAMIIQYLSGTDAAVEYLSDTWFRSAGYDWEWPIIPLEAQRTQAYLNTRRPSRRK
jgi:hypothetical protein